MILIATLYRFLIIKSVSTYCAKYVDIYEPLAHAQHNK